MSLEDYYQVGAFGSLIPKGRWYRFESRIEQSTARTLDLLDDARIKATFFVLGWVAERYPELVRSVRERGHEIASKGFQGRTIGELSRGELADDLIRAREAIERASGHRVRGCRVSGWMTPADGWALEVMAEQGYLYDSSMRPLLRSHAAAPETRQAHLHHAGKRTIWEVPVSSVSLLGCDIPLAGGNWFRQLPPALIHRALATWHRDRSSPLVLYFQSWELDPEQPRIQTASRFSRLRHYRNLDRMPEILRHYFARYAFTGVGDWLGAPRGEVAAAPDPGPVRVATAPRAAALVPPAASLPRVRVSVVVPCYNEQLVLPYLANTLRRLEDSLLGAYDLRFLFVDDGSTDGTLEVLRRLFGDWPNATVLRHAENLGIAAAIRTGMQAAATEIVCSIDCDCTYDPHELARMIPRLRRDVDLVVASPLHPEGAVFDVPAWRVAASRALSRLYRLVLRQPLHGYTSCFRVYRRSSTIGLPVRRGGFRGITELLGRLDLAGGVIVEHPATLEARMFGESKTKVLRAVVGHLGLLGELAWLRLVGGRIAARRSRSRAPRTLLDAS